MGAFTEVIKLKWGHMGGQALIPSDWGLYARGDYGTDNTEG